MPNQEQAQQHQITPVVPTDGGTLMNYLSLHESQLGHAEQFFVEEFLFPLLGESVQEVEPQHPFIDRTGSCRRIDFAYRGGGSWLAIEIDGESYHAEGALEMEAFDDSLFRQNEILAAGFKLIRFSYNQLLSRKWRELVRDTLREFFGSHAPELLTQYSLKPTALQREALDSIEYYRGQHEWEKGIIVLPTGTGKTILSAMDAKRHGGRVLFLVHRLDILKQSVGAFQKVWPDVRVGVLTGEERANETSCDVLFASKDTLRKPDELARFGEGFFDYIIVDEVHHGQSPSYKEVLAYFRPKFMLGMTATPDRADRRDIFELFDYNKIHEVTLQEAIAKGYLVPFTYYGLTDNVDYSKIRYQNKRYNVVDLERNLIVPERNEAIVREYIEKGQGAKAIGFCVSILHAERMAEVFTNAGITAEAIHSERPDRHEVLEAYRNNQIQVVFTVDLFNEGVDIPNARVLLFLRPTESKTVFMQQLGRGLRLAPGKERLIVLDFIGKYRRANQIRNYLSSGHHETGTGSSKKIVYTYSPGCEVVFDPEVEEILDRQDAESLGITKEDLKDAYFELAEKLNHKPTKDDLDAEGHYKSSRYVELFGSWTAFLREVGEYTESSYHYPQGVHLGHILSILHVFGSGTRAGSHFDDKYVRLRGNLDKDRLGTYQRQVKYKLQAAMELGILPDDRNFAEGETYPLQLTPQGTKLYKALRPWLRRADLNFRVGENGVPSTTMTRPVEEYNDIIRTALDNVTDERVIFDVFLKMHAVRQMLAYIYHIERKKRINRQHVIQQFFDAPFVKQYCEREGIKTPSLEAARRRVPFLLNILDSCGIIEGDTEISVNKLVLSPYLVKHSDSEPVADQKKRFKTVRDAWPDASERVDSHDLSIVRELFGRDFLTNDYHLKQVVIIDD